MRLLIIISIISIVSKACLGQDSAIDAWSFHNSISKEANRVYHGSYSIINVDSLNNVILGNGTAQIKMDTIFNWKILFECSVSWKHVVGKKPEFDILPKKNIIKYTYDSSKVYKGSELFNGFGINSFFLKDSVKEINAFPVIYQRNDKWNEVWVPILSNNYLVLRYVHSYPDGNMTSFYGEYILYFKRVE